MVTQCGWVFVFVFNLCLCFEMLGNIVVWSVVVGDTGWVGGSGAGGNNRASA